MQFKPFSHFGFINDVQLKYWDEYPDVVPEEKNKRQDNE
jgi:hypothetical protein